MGRSSSGCRGVAAARLAACLGAFTTPKRQGSARAAAGGDLEERGSGALKREAREGSEEQGCHLPSEGNSGSYVRDARGGRQRGPLRRCY